MGSFQTVLEKVVLLSRIGVRGNVKGVPGVSACYRRIQQPHVVKLYLPLG